MAEAMPKAILNLSVWVLIQAGIIQGITDYFISLLLLVIFLNAAIRVQIFCTVSCSVGNGWIQSINCLYYLLANYFSILTIQVEPKYDICGVFSFFQLSSRVCIGFQWDFCLNREQLDVIT